VLNPTRNRINNANILRANKREEQMEKRRRPGDAEAAGPALEEMDPEMQARFLLEYSRRRRLRSV
jgi:hypothetical protein